MSPRLPWSRFLFGTALCSVFNKVWGSCLVELVHNCKILFWWTSWKGSRNSRWTWEEGFSKRRDKVDTMHLSIRGWVDAQNVAYTYNGVLFTLKNEGSAYPCDNRDEPWGHAKWKSQLTKSSNSTWSHLHEVPRVKFMKTESWRVVATGWAGGEMGS